MRSFASLAILFVTMAVATLHGQSSDPATLYQQAVRREMVLRQELDAAPGGRPGGLVLERIRILVGSYDDLDRLFAKSEISDDALSHGGLLAADAFAKFGEPVDRDTALRLLKTLATRFPSSALARQATARVRMLDAIRPSAPPVAVTTIAKAPAPTPTPAAAEPPASPAPTTRPPAASAASSLAPARAVSNSTVTLQTIQRELLDDVFRVTLELDREVGFYDERIEGPPRVFIDLANTRAAESLKDATIPFPEGPVKQVRIGRQLNNRTRVVLDLNGAGSHSVYAVYNPYRIVIDFPRAPEGTAPVLQTQSQAVATPARAPMVMASNASRSAPLATPPRTASPADARPAPTPPPQNANGSFSLARQLGLGVTRIVVDPGHGGHDPGGRGNGIAEAALVLDVAMRLEQLLTKQQNFEVVLTRRTDAYVSLEERTALANRSDADLFLSIHANASTAASARGIETYFLNFASNPEAEAIAARENAGSAKSMRHLPDIVQAIAMNNKLDESRDFATMVQSTLYDQLRRTNKTLKNLGVKQAPFMVLVGAQMPSVLAEISFMSNSAEADRKSTRLNSSHSQISY